MTADLSHRSPQQRVSHSDDIQKEATPAAALTVIIHLIPSGRRLVHLLLLNIKGRHAQSMSDNQ